jgi:F-type H+-transporting ATPase subunit b
MMTHPEGTKSTKSAKTAKSPRRTRVVLLGALLVLAPAVGPATTLDPTTSARLPGRSASPWVEGWSKALREAAGGTVRAAEAEGAEAAPAEHGGEAAGEEHGPTLAPGKLGLQLLNFAVLLFVLVKFGGGAINKMLAARHHQLKGDLASAAELRAAAEAKLAVQEQRLARLENELASLRQNITAEAEAEKQRLIAAADVRARRIAEETSFLVEQQIREAEVKLRRESAEVALRIAEDILRRVVGPVDQERFLDKFLADSEASSAARPAVASGTPTVATGGGSAPGSAPVLTGSPV